MQARLNKDDFYIALEKALHNYLKSKLQIETSDFSKDKIQNILIERQVNEPTVLEFISILEHCELARYTPITNVEMQHDYDKSVSKHKTLGNRSALSSDVRHTNMRNGDKHERKNKKT